MEWLTQQVGYLVTREFTFLDWFYCGLAAAVLAGLWALVTMETTPRSGPQPEPTTPSEIIAVVFGLIVFGPISLTIVGIATVIMLGLGACAISAHYIDEAYDRWRTRQLAHRN